MLPASRCLANQLLSAGLLVSLDENATARFGDIRSSIRGWLPVRLSFHGHKPRVEWLFFGHKVLSEPFFQQSVSRLRADNQNVATRTTGPNILLRCKQEIPPSGFIFHVSRCGSTLLSNALKTVPGMVVISEANPAAEPLRGIPYQVDLVPCPLLIERQLIGTGAYRGHSAADRSEQRAGR